MITVSNKENIINTLTFQLLGNKIVEARFDSGKITKVTGTLLLREIVVYDAERIEDYFVDMFLYTYGKEPKEIIPGI